MNRRGTIRTTLVSMVLLSALPALAFCRQEPSRESGMTRDDLYRTALARLEALEKVWNEAPGSSAVSRAAEELRASVSELGTGKTEVESGKTKTAPPPQGPFPPSQQPSPESEQEKRRKATEDRFLSGGPLEKERGKASLQGVPEEWIAKSRDRALAELTRLGELTKKSPLERKPIEESLEEIASSIRGMPNPPPPK